MNLFVNMKEKVFGASKGSRSIYDKSPAELQMIRDNLQRRMDAFSQMEAHLSSPEWEWLTKTFIPIRMTELSNRQRQDIKPEDAQANLRFAGRFDELEQLSEYFADIQSEINICRNEINRIQRAMEIAQRRT